MSGQFHELNKEAKMYLMSVALIWCVFGWWCNALWWFFCW